jgi:hypothetical protein
MTSTLLKITRKLFEDDLNMTFNGLVEIPKMTET